jgi:hypothetical protein
VIHPGALPSTSAARPPADDGEFITDVVDMILAGVPRPEP